MNYNHIIILLSSLIILSYVFGILAKRFKVPSVLMLLGTGILLRYAARARGLDFIPSADLLNVLGTLGLILIVLEAALDLRLSRGKGKVVLRSMGIAVFLTVVTALALAAIIQGFIVTPFFNAFLYAIPLSIISSAIVIPSIHGLGERTKEFMIYEATFSDIAGIILFNFFALNPSFGPVTVASAAGASLFTALASFLIALVLIAALDRIRTRERLFLLLSVLVLLYAVGKQLHLSSLLLIFVFGIIINNTDVFVRGSVRRLLALDAARGERDLTELKLLVGESSFVVRTLFFVLFGYAITLSVLTDVTVLLIGGSITVFIYLVRYVNLRFLAKAHVFPQILIAPRGLISILLFYSIPAHYRINDFTEGIVFVVVIVTSLVMTVGLALAPAGEEGKTEEIVLEK